MRLEHRENPIASGRFRRRERRVYLGGMMRVIVHEQKARALILDFKTAPGVLKTAERGDDLLKRDAQLHGERNDPQRVAHVVAAGNVQNGFAQLLAPAENTENGREILQVDVRAAIIRVRGETERDGARARATDPRGVWIIRAIKSRPGGLIEQF